jgi:hypothetical protein
MRPAADRARLGGTLSLAIGLAGCASPITNELFYEEAAFLDALPTAGRLAAPSAFVDAVPIDPVFTSAAAAAEELQGLTQPLLVCTDALVATPPDARGDTFRTWDLVPVVVVTGTGSFEWWVRGTVVEVDGTAWTFTIDGAPGRAGPWAELASGRHEASKAGFVTWNVANLGEVLGIEATGLVEYVYAPLEDGTTAFEARLLSDPFATEPLSYWGVQGDAALSWSDRFEVTSDGETWPGVAVAVQTPAGGRADGVVWRTDSRQVSFGACWDDTGSTVWTGGDPEAVAVGDPEACAFGPLLSPALP